MKYPLSFISTFKINRNKVRCRYKTYSEFLSGIQIVHRDNRGVNIVCKRGNYVFEKLPYKPWNSAETKRKWFVSFYCRQILLGIRVSKKIKRIGGFEMLGAQCMYQDIICVICNAEPLVNEDTGEVVQRLTLYNKLSNQRFTVLETNVQL